MSNARVLQRVRRVGGWKFLQYFSHFVLLEVPVTFPGALGRPLHRSAAHQRTSVREQTVDKARLLMGETACTSVGGKLRPQVRTVEHVGENIRANERLIEYRTGRANTPGGARYIPGGRPLRVPPEVRAPSMHGDRQRTMDRCLMEHPVCSSALNPRDPKRCRHGCSQRAARASTNRS